VTSLLRQFKKIYPQGQSMTAARISGARRGPPAMGDVEETPMRLDISRYAIAPWLIGPAGIGGLSIAGSPKAKHEAGVCTGKQAGKQD
jgi:hypothetical protein